MTVGLGRVELDHFDPRLPLHVRLRERLLERIESGEWDRKHAMPAEAAFASHYGVAVGTVRRVLGQLADEGILDRRHGAGTYVARADLSRSLVQCFGLPAPHETQWRVVSRRLTSPPVGVRRALELDDDAQRLQLRRVWSLDDTPRVIEDVWLGAELADVADTGPAELTGELFTVYERQAGVIIVRVEETTTVAPRAGRDAVLLRCDWSDPLIVVERTSFARGRRPVEYARVRGQASQFRHRSEYH